MDAARELWSLAPCLGGGWDEGHPSELCLGTRLLMAPPMTQRVDGDRPQHGFVGDRKLSGAGDEE